MQKSCWNCKYCNNDYYFATGTMECEKFDDMTEEDIEKYWTNEEDGCPYYECEED